MTAANQIAQTIISDSYFLKLYRVCVERSVLRTLNIDTEEKYTEKEIRDLLRFADLLSTSSISDARNYAYKIITYLNPYYKDNVYYHTVAKAVYSNLGNFPAISYLEADNNNTSNLPFDRSVQNEAKKLIQEVPDGVGHVFTDIQYDLFSKLISSREFSFSGPTSMGKSFVIKAFLRCAIQNTPQENFIILVPSRALINQYAIELKSEMGALLETNNYKIVTNSNIAELPINEQCNYVLILTPERLISYISQEKNPSIGFLFVDEAHKLAQTEDARSITTYTSIEKTLKKYPDIKLYFASPNVSNPEILLSMFRNGKAENTFKTQETPVAQNLYFIDLLEKKLSYCLNDEFIPMTQSALDDISSINDVLLRFGQRSNLIYCNAKAKAISYAKELAATIECSDNKALKRAASIIRAYIHPDYYLADLVQKEIAYHFGNMPQLIRNLIEDLYREGHLKYIFCTSTLLEGVNMPTQNLFILDDKKAKKVLKPIAVFSAWGLFANGSIALNNKGVLMLLNMFFSPAIVTARAITVQVNMAANQFVTNFQTSETPQIVKRYAVHDYDGSKRLLLASTKYSYYLSLLICLPILLLTESLLRFWLGTFPDYTIAFVQIVTVQSLFQVFDTSFYTALYAKGSLRENALLSPTLGFLQFPLIYLLFKLGYSPIVLSWSNLLICMFLALFIKPFLLVRIVGYDWCDIGLVFKSCLRVTIVALLLPLLLRWCVDVTCLDFWGSLGYLILIILSVFTSVFYVGIDKEIREKVISYIKNKILKCKTI